MEPFPRPDIGRCAPSQGQAYRGTERGFKFTRIRDSFFAGVLTDFWSGETTCIQWLTPADDCRLGQFTRSFFIGPAFCRRFRQPDCQMVSEIRHLGEDLDR